jgi:hypothetical protein
MRKSVLALVVLLGCSNGSSTESNPDGGGADAAGDSTAGDARPDHDVAPDGAADAPSDAAGGDGAMEAGNSGDTCTPAGGQCMCGACPSGLQGDPGNLACPAPPPNSGRCSEHCCAPDLDAGPVADSGGGPCDAGACQAGLSCCDGQCVNLANDPLHCGTCRTTCTGDTPMCNGTCKAQACAPACQGSQVCCIVPAGGPMLPPPTCLDGPTCPVGCPNCR